MARTMTLPPDEVARLRALRTEDMDRFRARIRDLHAVGWTYAALALPFMSPRATAQVWDRRSASRDVIPPADDIPTPPEQQLKSQTREVFAFVRPTVPEAEVVRLRELSEQVRTIRGWTPADSPARAAAEELEELIADLESRGVSYASIARAMGVTYRAVAARMARRKLDESAGSATSDVVAVA